MRHSTDGPVSHCPKHGDYSLHTGCFGCDDDIRLQAAVTSAAFSVYIGQSRADSAIEVAVNIAIGAAVSLAAQELIFPLYGIHVGTGTHLGIVAAFTVVSVARQYVIRRLCNGRSPWMAFKRRFNL